MILTLLAATLLAGQATQATEPPLADPSVKPHYPTLPVITQNEHLYEAFGGKEGLTALMDDAMTRWLANPRTRPFFEHADQARIKDLLVKQFCVVMHGPCTYDGRTMAEAHRGLNISEGSFYALVEELQVAMNQRHIPFNAQNRLVAALAPMHRDIIDNK